MRLRVRLLLFGTLQVGLLPCQVWGEKEPSKNLISAMVGLPEGVRNPRLFALGEGMGVAYISTRRLVSRDWRLYRYEIAAENIEQTPGRLGLTPAGRFSLPLMGGAWPEFAAEHTIPGVLIVFQRPTEVLTVYLASAAALAPGPTVTLDNLVKIAGPESLSAPCGFSFLKNQTSAGREGLCGTDSGGLLWLSTARRGAGEGKTWDLSTPLAGYLRFHPRGIFVSDKTVALFFVDRGRAGGVRMATVQEESPGVWKKTSEAAVYPGDATALALGAHNDEICLLGSQRCDGGQELRLFISRDGAKSWKLRTKGEVSLEGDVCDIALIDNCSRAVGVIKTASAGGEPRHTIFVVELTSRAGGPRGSGGVPSQATP